MKIVNELNEYYFDIKVEFHDILSEVVNCNPTVHHIRVRRMSLLSERASKSSTFPTLECFKSQYGRSSSHPMSPKTKCLAGVLTNHSIEPFFSKANRNDDGRRKGFSWLRSNSASLITFQVDGLEQEVIQKCLSFTQFGSTELSSI